MHPISLLPPAPRLVPLTLTHTAELFTLVDRERARLRLTMPWLDATATPAAMQTFLAASVQERQVGRARRYLIEVAGSAAGVASIEHLDTDDPRIAYWIGSAFEGLGLVSASVTALVREGFGLGLPRLRIAAGVENARSQAVARRCGFRMVAVQPRAECLYGHWVDHMLFEREAVDSP